MLIDVIIPTFNRMWALPRVTSFYLAMKDVRRVIVVDDASTDGAGDWLGKQAALEPRLVPLFHPRNRGASAARNTGATATEAPLVFFADDDMVFQPENGLELLMNELRARAADIVAPIHVLREEDLPAELPAEDYGGNRTPPTLYDERTLELRPRRLVATWALPSSLPTPLAGAWMLMRREVLAKVRYDEGLGVTSYRDETDFQLKAAKEGFRLLACARPVMIDLARAHDSGGCHSTSRAEYVVRACRNNWRILLRHRDTIRERLGIRAPIAYLQACFILRHVGYGLILHEGVRLLRRVGLRS